MPPSIAKRDPARQAAGTSPREAPSGAAQRARTAPAQAPARPARRADIADEDFPGCRPVRIRRSEIGCYEGRIEFWDARRETAYVAEPTTTHHEGPAGRLAALVALVAAVRGAPIATFRTADLLLRGPDGERARIMQADEAIYIHPGRDGPTGAAMEVAERLPDVVLEVDFTTDVRRRKLSLYEEWGAREVWVEVPDAPGRRPRSRRPGLTIHVLGADGRYAPAGASVAFPGWRAEEIHLALGEPELSSASAKALRRVGRALGERDGTTQDDHPVLRAERRESRAEGFAKGHAEGFSGGHAEGHAEGLFEGRRLTREEMVEPLRGLLRRMVERRFGKSAAKRARAWADGVDCRQTILRALEGMADARNGTEFTANLETYRQP